MKLKKICYELPELEYNTSPLYVYLYLNSLMQFVQNVAGNNPEYERFKHERSQFILTLLRDNVMHRALVHGCFTVDIEWFLQNYIKQRNVEHAESYHTIRLIKKVTRHGLDVARCSAQCMSLLLLQPRYYYMVFYDFKFTKNPCDVFIEVQRGPFARKLAIHKTLHWLWMWNYAGNYRVVTFNIWKMIAMFVLC
jgi:hypothetical protein